MAWGNILRGVPINPQHRFVGSLAGLLNPYALWAGLTTAALFTLHGAVYLTLRTEGEVLERSRALARRIAWPAAVAVVGFLVWTYVNAERAGYRGLVPPLVPVAAMGAVIAVSWLLHERLEGWAFAATAVTIVLVTATILLNLYPRVMVSSLGPGWGPRVVAVRAYVRDLLLSSGLDGRGSGLDGRGGGPCG